jgi:acetyl-CoA C-acetyltransferase
VTDDAQPVVIGVGQLTHRIEDAGDALEPLGLMEHAARLALDDAGAPDAVARHIDCVGTVMALGWRYAQPSHDLAARLGLAPRRHIVPSMGGNTPQSLINHVADEIRAGRVKLALLSGGEAVRSRRLARKQGKPLAWTPWNDEPAGSEVLGGDRPGTSELEETYGLTLPTHVYPLFENALRASEGRSPAAHSEHVARIMSRFSEVASENPNAWFRDKRSADEICRVTATNRMVGFPYTKYMNAIMEVDQGAALVVAASGAARALGIPEERWVWIRGGGDAEEAPWFLSGRPAFDRSPPLRVCASRALAQAQTSIDEIEAFDLYSCFPSAVEIACRELGIDPLGDRPLTVTGGLPYAGGPGNNYAMHAVVRMAERLRQKPGSHGLVTALGWYLSKHAAGVYASAPPEAPAPPVSIPAPRAAPITLAAEADGAATLETYTVLHDRDGTPARGICVGRLDDGRRFLAHTPTDRQVLEGLMVEEGVGRRGRVRRIESHNVFDPDGAVA